MKNKPAGTRTTFDGVNAYTGNGKTGKARLAALQSLATKANEFFTYNDLETVEIVISTDEDRNSSIISPNISAAPLSTTRKPLTATGFLFSDGGSGSKWYYMNQVALWVNDSGEIACQPCRGDNINGTNDYDTVNAKVTMYYTHIKKT